MKNNTSSMAVFIAMSIGLAWTIIFSALKLFGVVDWSWWIVAGPTIFMVVIVIASVVYVNIALKDVD